VLRRVGGKGHPTMEGSTRWGRGGRELTGRWSCCSAIGKKGEGRHSWELGCSSFTGAMDPGRLDLPCALRSREREPTKAGAELGKKGSAKLPSARGEHPYL
jgi:hypothetical protein